LKTKRNKMSILKMMTDRWFEFTGLDFTNNHLWSRQFNKRHSYNHKCIKKEHICIYKCVHIYIYIYIYIYGVHAVAQLVEALRYKSEGAGSIPDGVIGFFHWHNPSGTTMALGHTMQSGSLNLLGPQGL